MTGNRRALWVDDDVIFMERRDTDDLKWIELYEIDRGAGQTRFRCG